MKDVKLKTCAHCGNDFRPFLSTQRVCSHACAIGYAKEKREKAEQKEWNVKKAQMSYDLKSAGQVASELQLLFNKIARLIDNGSLCMMCNCPMKRKNGCHYHSQGSNPTIRFNLYNIHIGCHSCNGEKGGNIIGYDNRLIETYGKERWEYVKFDIVRETEPLHLTKDELQALKKPCKQIIKELEKEDLVRTPEQRWKLRGELNKRIGIYC